MTDDASYRLVRRAHGGLRIPLFSARNVATLMRVVSFVNHYGGVEKFALVSNARRGFRRVGDAGQNNRASRFIGKIDAFGDFSSADGEEHSATFSG